VLRVAAALLLTPLASAGAQLAELQPGTRVRVRAPSVVAGRLEGVVVQRVADTVVVTRPNAGPVSLPIAAITRAEVSRGRSRGAGALRGALWGGGVGLALGALAAAAPNECNANCEDEATDVGLVVGTPVLGAAVGAAVGTAVGAERWVPLRVPVRATFAPRRGSLEIELSVTF